MLKFAVPIFVFLSFTAAWGDEKKPDAANDRVEKLFRSMRDGSYRQDQADWQFPVLRWEDIPALLKLGGSKEKLKRFPINPLSSQAEQVAPREGVVALWCIDGIRKGGKFPSLNALLEKEGKIDRSEDAQMRAYEAYQRWWKKVEKMPVEDARKVEPLVGTGLHWYGEG
jgi:hypothetical protein